MKSASPRCAVFSIAAALLLAACDKQKPVTPTGSTETPPAPKAEKRSDTTRIVSWNLQWFPGHKPDATDAVAAEHMAAVPG